MIGVGFLLRIVQIAVYVALFIGALTVLIVGLSWVIRMAVAAHYESLRSHIRWFFSKLPSPIKWVWTALTHTLAFVIGVVVGRKTKTTN